jgi:hypothetical protein
MGRVHAATACLHVALVVLAACGSNKDDDGELGAHCYPNATCNVGLTCNGGICLVTDAAVDAPADVMIDAPPDAFVCPTDAYEPNNSIADAYVTTVAGTTSTQALSASLCPGTDKDYFTVVITVASTNLELLVDRPANDNLVQASILNSGGVPIANAAVTTTPTRLRAYTPNLPTGTYYAETYTASPTNAMGAHAYTATLTVTGP